jgi:hypothetical protein
VDDLKPPPNSVGDTLFSNSAITSSPPSILVSPSYLTQLALQTNGNLVLSDVSNGRVYWSSNTAGKGFYYFLFIYVFLSIYLNELIGNGPYTLTLGSDGNMKLTDSSNTVTWTSNTPNLGFAPYRLKLRDIVNLTLVDSNSSPFWSATVSL